MPQERSARIVLAPVTYRAEALARGTTEDEVYLSAGRSRNGVAGCRGEVR
jgi:hypothetical protein